MDGRACKQYIFRSCNTSTLNALNFDKNPFTCQCETEDKNTDGFQILHFYWSFSSDIMAVKGLSCWSSLLLSFSTCDVSAWQYLKYKLCTACFCVSGSCFINTSLLVQHSLAVHSYVMTASYIWLLQKKMDKCIG